MKPPLLISLCLLALCLFFGLVGAVIGFSSRSLRAEVRRQEKVSQAAEAKLESQRQALYSAEHTAKERTALLQSQRATEATQKKALQEQENRINKQLEAQEAQEQEIKVGNLITESIAPALLKDMGTASIKNEKMKALLAKHGYTVTTNP